MEPVADQECLFEDSSPAGAPSRRRHVRNSLVFRKAPHSPLEPRLLPPSVEDLIPEDDPVRAYKVMLNALGFQALLDTYLPFGGVSYDPRVLAAAWLFASTDGVHTSRELEKRCRFDVRYWFLTGGHCPDHTTLSRFRLRLKGVGQEFFSETNNLARELGLGTSGAATIDGRKTAGALDQWTRLGKDATEEELAAVSDSEARTLWCTRSGYVNGYSCMVGVDARDDVIVGACLSQESSDNKSLGQLLQAVEAQSGTLPQTLVMDAGFSGSDSTGQLADKGVEAFISPKEEQFWDLDAAGEVICPAGHRLVKTEHKNLLPGQRQTYRIAQCTHCPLRALCGLKTGNKTLQVHQGQDPRDWVRAMVLARTPEGRERLAYRKGSIERLFAQLFYHQRFRRFTMRGLDGAGIQLLILCAAHNLRVLAALMRLLLGSGGIAALERLFWRCFSSLAALLARHGLPTGRRFFPQPVAAVRRWSALAMNLA